MVVVAGVDVGKANLDVSVSEGPVLRFDNMDERQSTRKTTVLVGGGPRAG